MSERRCARWQSQADRVECGQPARFAPSIRIWAIGDWKLDPKRSLLLRIDLPLCATHASEDITFEEIMTSEGWEKVCSALEEHGKARPDRRTARVEIEDICHVERLELFSREERGN